MEWVIYTHERPDADAIAAIWLMKRFGEKKLPGINTAKIVFVGSGNEVPKGKGIISIDIGGGPFDHHPQDMHGEECATTLVAKFLEIDDDPALEKILRFVTVSDLKGGNQPFDLAYIAKLMDDPEKAMNWVIEGLETKYAEQLSFFVEAKKEFEEKAEIEDIEYGDKGTFKMVTIVSDTEEVSKYARSSHGCNALVVIQKQSSGNVQIFSNQRLGVRFHDVASLIRVEEMELKRIPELPKWEELSAEGKIPGAEEWYFHAGLQVLLNGSATATKVPPTKIPLSKIKELVKLGINFTFYPHKACREEKRCIRRYCPYFKYGLSRSRKLRYQEKSGQEE